MPTLALERPSADRFASPRTNLALVAKPGPPTSCNQAPCIVEHAIPCEQDALSAIEMPLAIPDMFVAEILKPYRPDAQYLRSARITECRCRAPAGAGKQGGLMTAAGEFSIPRSCYIDDTGHFNAVEFNICYNQLAYVAFGKAIEAGILTQLRSDKADGPSFSDFKRNQLPSMVIVSIESRYYKPLDGKAFRGELTLDRISSVGQAWFLTTAMTFADDQGVKAKGTVVLAYNPAYNPAVEGAR